MSMIRTRADIIRNLREARHEAGRVTVADPDHAAWHAAIDLLLTELDHTPDCLPSQHTTADERTTASEQATP